MITTTRQFEDKLIKFINSYYNRYYDIEDIRKIRMTSTYIYVNINPDKIYHVYYDRFSKFNY